MYPTEYCPISYIMDFTKDISLEFLRKLHFIWWQLNRKMMAPECVTGCTLGSFNRGRNIK